MNPTDKLVERLLAEAGTPGKKVIVHSIPEEMYRLVDAGDSKIGVEYELIGEATPTGKTELANRRGPRTTAPADEPTAQIYRVGRSEFRVYSDGSAREVFN